MTQVNIHEAKTHLSRLIQRVIAGEEIIIAKSGDPVARLGPIEGKKRIKRTPGGARGQVRIHGDFDAPLPEEISKAFGANPR